MVMSAMLVTRVVADPYIALDVITAVRIIHVMIAVRVIITAKWLGVTQEILQVLGEVWGFDVANRDTVVHLVQTAPVGSRLD